MAAPSVVAARPASPSVSSAKPTSISLAKPAVSKPTPKPVVRTAVTPTVKPVKTKKRFEMPSTFELECKRESFTDRFICIAEEN